MTAFSFTVSLPTLIELDQALAQAAPSLPPSVVAMISGAISTLGSPTGGQNYNVRCFGDQVPHVGTPTPIDMTFSASLGGPIVDTREQILLRILAIITGLPGIVLAARNRIEVSGTNRPAAILHDGVEEEASQDSIAPPPRGSLKQFMSLQPRIVIMTGGTSDAIGAAMSAFRAALLPAILGDTTLQQLCGGPSGLRGQTTMLYLGSTLETAGGATTEATLEFNFRFHYVLSMEDLAS